MATIFNEKPWWQFALIRITIALIIGIVTEHFLPIPYLLIYLVFFTCLLLWFCFTFLPVAKKYSYAWLGGVSLNGLFICIGAILLSIHTAPALPQQKIIILEPLIEKPNSYQTLATMGETNLLIYFKKDSNNAKIMQGKELFLLKEPTIISNATNPGGFNFKDYAASQKIYYSIYLTPKDYKIIGVSKIGFTKQFISKLKNNVLATINQYIHTLKEKSVAEALLIGYKKNLDKDLLQAYSSTGVVHIIAISGLHLAMIYGLMLVLLKPLKYSRYTKWLKPLLLLIVIWLFTILTGAAPSILRSAIMFSFIILGEQQGRANYTLNTLAASAFCMLVYNPLFLWDIGFQLSYAAVTSIILFAKPIEKFWYFKNGILRYCWQLCSITLAAQLLTLPLLLFYFHQFPNLFLFTNFLAVPLSGIILYLEIALLILAPIPIIAEQVGAVTQLALQFLNRVIENTASLPFAVTNHIQVSLVQCFCLYLIIFFVATWLWQKKSTGFVIALTCTTIFFGIRTVDIIQRKKQQKLLVYYMPKFTAIDLIEGTAHQYLGDPAVFNRPILQKNYLAPTRTLYRASHIATHSNAAIHPPLLFVKNKTILLLRPNVTLPNSAVDKKIDLIIVAGSPKLNLQTIASQFKGAQIVFDCSNPLWKIERWKKEAEHLHLRHHSVPEQGAFELDLSK